MIINKKNKEHIKSVITYAKAHPIRNNILRTGFVVGNNKSHCCDFQNGLHIVFSIEEQPQGWFSHLAISIPDKRKLVNVELAGILMKEFGLSIKGDIHDASSLRIDETSKPMSINLFKRIDDDECK